MNTLAFDTSGPVLSVALQCGTAPIREKIHLGALEHMEHILVFIDALLKDAKIQIGDVDRFLINRGPGSFTGLRIGFSVLKGFLAAQKKPSFGCDALDVIAEKIPAKQKHLAVATDAFRSKFYVKVFENAVVSSAQSKNINDWQPLSEPAALTFEQTVQLIPAGALIAGNALQRHAEVFTKAGKNFVLAPEELWFPHASSLISLEKSRPAALKKLVFSLDFLPTYLRQSEPEERKNEMSKK